MTSLKEEHISSNSTGPSSILRKEGSSTQLRKKHLLSKKKDIFVNLTPPKNDYVQIVYLSYITFFSLFNSLCSHLPHLLILFSQ